MFQALHNSITNAYILSIVPISIAVVHIVMYLIQTNSSKEYTIIISRKGDWGTWIFKNLHKVTEWEFEARQLTPKLAPDITDLPLSLQFTNVCDFKILFHKLFFVVHVFHKTYYRENVLIANHCIFNFIWTRGNKRFQIISWSKPIMKKMH